MELETLQELITKELAVAIYFSSPNCNVCHALKPKVEALFLEEFPKINYVHSQIAAPASVAAEYTVFSAPTLLVFFEGKETIRKVRLMGIQELYDQIKRPYDMLFR